MKRILFTGIYLVASLCAANKDFNGRWDITVPENDRKRAWWFEVNNAESGKPTGTFISAFGGDLNKYDEGAIANDELHIVFRNNNGQKP